MTLPPTKNTFHPPPVERIPICPAAKFQPCFLGMEHPALVSPPEMARASPWQRGKKMLQIIEGADSQVFPFFLSFFLAPWQVPLGGYQDVNGRDRAVWRREDLGGGGELQRCTSSGWAGLVTSAMFWQLRALLNIHGESRSLSIRKIPGNDTRRWLWHRHPPPCTILPV